MNNKRVQCELHKVVREINTHGDIYTFYRKKKDKYGEDTKENETFANNVINGLFHLSKGYSTKSVSDGTETHSKGQPMLLAEHKKALNIKKNDIVFINEKMYKVVDKNNIQEYNILTDISLELMI